MTAVADPWADVVAARIPAAALVSLAPLRTRPDVTVTMHGDECWVRWSGPATAVVRYLLPIDGVILLSRRPDGSFARYRSRVPTATVPPADPGVRLGAVLHPGKVEPRPPRDRSVSRIPVTFVRGVIERPTTAIACSTRDLTTWAESVTATAAGRLRVARLGERLFVRGTNLPPIPAAVRFAGSRLFITLGERLDPALPDDVYLAAWGVVESEMAFVSSQGIDIVPVSAFGPVSLAALRLAGAEI